MHPKTPIASITIPADRQRREFLPTEMQELAYSIESLGLLHAPVMRLVDGNLTLVAGERRFRALKQLFTLGQSFRYNGEVYTAEAGQIPYVSLGDLSPLEAEEAELDENLRRVNLTWQEHAAAVQKLHALRTAQKAQNLRTQSLPDPLTSVLQQTTHTIADTARELHGRSDGAYQDTVRKEVIVAKHLNSNPAVAKAKSLDEAFKILKREETRTQNVALAQKIGQTLSADSHTLLNADCLAYMQGLVDLPSSRRFDVILSDPPYGMDAQDFGDGGGKLSGIEHHYDDSLESWRALMSQFAPLTYAVTKPEAHAYLFCDLDNFHELKSLMEAAGWYVFRTPLIAHKLGGGRVPLPDRGPRRCYETILYAIKGKKPVTAILPDVIPCAADDNLGHGAQKPVALFQNLLQRSVRPGDSVFDAFAGTGPILEAAHTLKCHAVACELNPEYFAIASRRLDNLRALSEGDAILSKLGDLTK